MQVVSGKLMDSFAAEQDRAFPHRFHRWWLETVDADADQHQTERLVFAHRDEFDVVGVEEDEERFLFLYARAIMPEMGDREYLEAMDAIFARKAQSERLADLAGIARKYGHRG